MENGGELSVTMVPVLAEFKENAAAVSAVELKIRDTGTGMDEETLEKIFDPFFTTKEGGQGTGLGLAQVLGIMQQHEGHVWAKSQEGKGATFTLLLPAVATTANPLPEIKDDVMVMGHGETVLVVEDDKQVLKALTLTLQDLNYRVIEANHGREALDILKKHRQKISLVITDMVMPVMGGKALFYAMKERRYEIPVIIITGHPMEAELEQLRQEGLGDWMIKPPEPIVLSQKMARLIRK
jgi:CheY-like chemotaxis protein